MLLLVALGCSRQPSTEPAPLVPGQTESSAEATTSEATVAAEGAAEASFAEDSAAEDGTLAGRLDVGSVAPPIEIAHWVQGEPVDQFQPGHTYVVEFWATWCGPCRDGMPHIAELQQQYQGNVTFIGVTGENEATVTSFLGKTQNAETGATWGDVVTYALALDASRATSTAYMRAAGRNGIPCAFIVGPDGHIEWIGHPAAIDEPLKLMAAGAWERSEYLVRQQEQQARELAMRRALMSLQKAEQAEDWGAALSALDDLIEQNPEQPGMMMFKLSLLLRAQQFQDASALAKQIADANWENSDQLNALAWTLATQRADSTEVLPLALRLAERASELHEGQDASTFDTLARIYYEQGNLDEAIANQEQAVELDAEIEGIEATLMRYRIERDGDAGDEGPSAAEETEADPENATDQVVEPDATAEPEVDAAE
jgi:thiol-disulfide isomerase/thioredoxin